MRIFLGVDAGNTKTLAVAATEDGAIIGSGRSGCGDIYGASTPEEALANIDGAVDVALESAGVGGSHLRLERLLEILRSHFDDEATQVGCGVR